MTTTLPRELAVRVDAKGITLALPDCGEDQVTVTLLLPSGERVDVGYNGFYGYLNITPYEPQDGSDKKTPGGPKLKPKPCCVTNWVDKFVNGKYHSSMHAAPKADGGAGDHERTASQIVIHVHPLQDDDV